MTDEQIALARRAVACKGWRWMPGMLVDSGGTIYRMTEKTIALGCGSPEFQREYMRPDLTDAATLGCLLALVREAHGRRCYTQASGGYWAVQNDDTEEMWGAEATEAEALVAALEAAP